MVAEQHVPILRLPWILHSREGLTFGEADFSWIAPMVYFYLPSTLKATDLR